MITMIRPAEKALEGRGGRMMGNRWLGVLVPAFYRCFVAAGNSTASVASMQEFTFRRVLLIMVCLLLMIRLVQLGPIPASHVT